jgi:hypothetical protein
MRTIDNQELDKVVGGWGSQISQTLSTLNTTLGTLNSQQQNQSSNYMLPMVMALALQNRNQPRVVSAGGATVVA